MRVRTYQERVRQREAEMAARAAGASPGAAPDAKRLRVDGAFSGAANSAPPAQAQLAAAAAQAERPAQARAPSAVSVMHCVIVHRHSTCQMHKPSL